MSDLALAARFARRELRGGFGGLPIFIACLAIGVAAIAGVGSIGAAVTAGLSGDARALLGGDVELRRTHRPLDTPQLAWLNDHGERISTSIEMRAMASPVDRSQRALVELKAVDDGYPLFGTAVLSPPLPLVDALADRGVVVDPVLLHQLDIAVGDRIEIGEASFTVRAALTREPDRIANAFSLGPRLMMAEADVAATGLVQPGSMVRYYYRLMLPQGTDIGVWLEGLEAAFPNADWRLRDARNVQPGLRQFIDRLSVYLILVGLTALLVGGIGVAGAVRSHLEARTATIATLKCLGASPGVIFRTYFTQILVLSAIGIAVGLVLGSLAPFAIAPAIGDRLPIDPSLGVYPGALAVAAVFGLLTAIVFTLWPLARAVDVPAAGLFRQIVMPSGRWPRRRYVFAGAAAVAALAVLAVVTASASDPRIGMWFAAAVVTSLIAFHGATWVLIRVVRAMGRPRHAALRLAVTNLARPGAATGNIVLSLGIGIAVLIAVALVEANLAGQIEDRVRADAPAFFFIDIQPDQTEAFVEAVAALPGTGRIEQTPMVRGRLLEIAGRPVDTVEVDPESRWVTRSDIGFTFAAEQPERANVVAGNWWPADYSGPPLISFDAKSAAGLGVGIGDSLTFSILGRPIEAEIANLRRIDWTSFGINFLVVFAPGTLEAAPYSVIATAHAAPAAEGPLVAAVGERFPNVSAIPVRAMIEALNEMVAGIAAAVRATASVTLAAGLLVLAGVVAAGRRRRVYDAVVLKVLGATRGNVLSAYLVEYALLGVATVIVAAPIGVLGAWTVVTQVMEDEWTFAFGPMAATVAAAILLTTLFGFLGTWRALGQKAAPILRTD